MARIGLKSNLSVGNISVLKRDLLFFDSLMFDVDAFNRLHELVGSILEYVAGPERAKVFSEEADVTLRLLSDQKLLVPYSTGAILRNDVRMEIDSEHGSLKFTTQAKPNLSQEDAAVLLNLVMAWGQSRQEEMTPRTQPIHLDGVDAVAKEYQRRRAIEMQDLALSYLLKRMSDPSNEYLPMLDESQLILDAKQQREAELAQIVRLRFPEPILDAPWEQILDFRADPDNRARLLAMRRWIARTAASDIRVTEAEEEIEYLLAEHERALQLSRLRYTQSTLELVVVTTIEILENLLKLNWSTAIRKLFDIRRTRVDFLLRQTELPGKELAYLSKLDDAFAKPQ